ncbi:hypothetical protein AVEN_255277-1 [Araneus ventricosus]|uniref:Uncharacterized protein n=1 Tax=Araneus ventricosus TaxID=182803 RepID=A0A4Y2BBJ5_ARAVE|nr:hypothetical protein AVEN_255277-1 [Araneus ventricosus]
MVFGKVSSHSAPDYEVTSTVDEVTSPCRSVWGPLKNNRCNSSDTEVGVLTVITGYGPAPPEGGTYRHRWGVTLPTPLLCPRGKRIPTYLYGDFSSTYSWCPPEGAVVELRFSEHLFQFWCVFRRICWCRKTSS